MLFLLLCFGVSVHADILGTARLSLIQGEVLVLTQDTGDEWIAASINMPLMPGDRLWVPEGSRAEIQFDGGTYLRADSFTEVGVTSIRRDRSGIVIQVAIPQGKIYVRYRDSSGSNAVFQADTPLISVMAYRSSKFGIDVYENGYTEVFSLDGTVFVESKNGNTRLSEGNMLAIGEDSYAELSPLRPKDDWARWNSARDTRFARAVSSRYLPPELGIYSGDFDDHGRWTYISHYGYVWAPSVVVTTWSPYRSGRWVWRHGEYVWISYEPWGWVPYHYGRWAFRAGTGWFWVPPPANAVVWAPGLVAWIYTPTYVSWVPLAPGEIYYGYGYYGSHSVNLTKVNIKNVNITNIYVNARVKNAVTVVSRDTFITGRKIKVVNAPDNPFLAGIRGFPGRPDIKPGRISAMPYPERSVPAKILPARKLTEKIWGSGMHKRPVAIQENTSVFRKGSPLVPMKIMKTKLPKQIAPQKKTGNERSALRTEMPGNPGQMQKGRNGSAYDQKGVPEIPVVKRQIPEKTGKVPKKQAGNAAAQAHEPGSVMEQKRTAERPTSAPRERTGNPSVRQQEVRTPGMQGAVTEKAKNVQKEHIGRLPAGQEKREKLQTQMKTREHAKTVREGRTMPQSVQQGGMGLQLQKKIKETPSGSSARDGGGYFSHRKGQGTEEEKPVENLFKPGKNTANFLSR